MPSITYITADFAVAGALAPEDFAEVAKLGFRAIVNNRPDGEEPGQLSARREAVLAWRAGLRFRHVPASKLEVFDAPVVDDMTDALASLGGPVLAHCKSGLRSAILWAAAHAGRRDVDRILAQLADAGLDLEAVREDLDAVAARAAVALPVPAGFNRDSAAPFAVATACA